MEIQENVPLAKLTTFKIGGSARYFVQVKTEIELHNALEFAEKHNLQVFVLGGGSNVLISDNGFDGLVIQIAHDALTVDENVDDIIITAGAGMNWDTLVEKSIEMKLNGIECLSGIPGTVGASPIQNIGAYGQELRDNFVSLRTFEPENKVMLTFFSEDCEFGYRDSMFRHNKDFIIWEVTLQLKKNGKPKVKYDSFKNYFLEQKVDKPNLSQIREAILFLRQKNHIDPKISGNAGSFFKNPIMKKEKVAQLVTKYPDIPHFPLQNGNEKLFAGWLIEQAGWKGKQHKNVMVSPKHSLIIINPDQKGTATEVAELADIITNDVFEKFGIKIEREVNYIGL